MRRRSSFCLATAAATALASTLVSPLPPAGADTTNLVRNFSFEAGTGGWYADGVGLLARGPGRTLGHAAQVTARTPGGAGINDGPSTVRGTVAGTTYAAEVYVQRTPAPAGGTSMPVTVQVNLKEFALTGVQDPAAAGQASQSITLGTNGWQVVSVSYVAKADGQQIGVSLMAPGLAAGYGYLIDDVSLTSAAPIVPEPDDRWTTVYRNDFTDLTDVGRAQSSVEVNSTLTPTDTGNSLLQKPSLRSNTAVVTDAGATDGKALGVFTRQGTYETASGPVSGWTNGRMTINGQNQSPPFRLETRIRLTESAKTKSAVMWWPAGGGWPWEVDFVEVFGGESTSDYWGGRQHVSQRWHSDLDGDGSAVEQKIHDDTVDATIYHTYTLLVLPDHMWIEIDGVKTYEVSDPRWIPDSPGFFTVGKAVTHQRNATGRTDDAVFVDYVEISTPTP